MYAPKFHQVCSAVLLPLCFAIQPLTASTFGLFTYTDDGTSVTITDYPDSAVGEVDIPAKIDGKNVIAIGDSAFHFCAAVTKVKIPEGVTSIGEEAFFSCEGMTSVVIPISVSSIGNRAFFGCSLLKKLDLPSHVTSIGVQTFSYCTSLSYLVIHSSVTNISTYAFYKCTSLNFVRFLGDAPAMGSNVFLDTAVDLMVHSYIGKTGFTVPIWLGYSSVADPTPRQNRILSLLKTDGSKLPLVQNFGSAIVGLKGSRKTFVIKNAGPTPLKIDAILIAGLNPDSFKLTLQDPALKPIADGDITTLRVDFNPIQVGAVKAVINISLPKQNTPLKITITGEGTNSLLSTLLSPHG